MLWAGVVVTGWRAVLVGLATGALLAGCSTAAAPPSPGDLAPLAKTESPSSVPSSTATRAAAPVGAPFRNSLPGMPPVENGKVYAEAVANRVEARIAHDPQYLYVPNSYGAPKTTVIDQRTHKVVRVLHTGTLSQHVTPSYDLRTLYVEASAADRLVAIDPKTGRIERRIAETRPYNLYFTPNGRQAVVMAEQDDQIVLTDPRTFKRQDVVHDRSCDGPNHADFSANGQYFLVTCEFSGSLLKISTTTHRVTDRLKLPPGAKPQDVRLSPSGRLFYVADMGRDELLRIPWNHLRVAGSTTLPAMPHGIYPSRNGRLLYVSDRMAGKISVVSVRTNKVIDTWNVPGGGHPDMGGLSADGRTL